MLGEVKYYNKTSGYGFIKPLDEETIIYFQKKQVDGSVTIKDIVKFKIKGERILTAIDVKKVDIEIKKLTTKNLK